MSIGQYLLGVGLLVATAASLAFVAVRGRRALLPGWEGAPARLAEVVAAVGLLLLVAELLGCVGLLRAGYLVAACAAAAVGSLRLSVPAGGEPTPAGEGPGRAATASAAGATALVLLQWGSRSGDALARGMADPDSLWYHLPHAARFAQEGFTTRLHFTESEPITTFHPANSELLHAIGMSLMGGFDLLSPFLNLGLAGVCLLAGWCIGRPFGAAPAALTGVAVVLLTPIMLQTQPGEAYNDVAALAFFLAAVALLSNAGGKRAPLAYAAFAAGLGLGTKLSLMAPTLLLGVAVVVAGTAGARLRTAGLWAAGLAAGGGFWFLRNLVRAGNPLPWFGVHLGPFSLPSPPNPMTDAYSFSLAHYLSDTGIWRRVFSPALHGGLGPVWELMLVGAVAGCLLALAAGRSPTQRSLGAVGLASLLAYFVTPASAGGPEGEAPLFGLNLRFATPSLALGLALLGAAPWAWHVRRLAAPALLLLAVLTLSGEGLWPPSDAWAGAAVVAVAGLGVHWARTPGARRGVTVVVTVVVAAVAGWPVQRGYFDARYAAPGPTLPRLSVWAARNLEHSRVGVVGYLLQYPLYGTRLTNRVDVLGERGPGGGFRRFSSCRRFTRAVIGGRYRYVVTQTEGTIALGRPRSGLPLDPREAHWIRAIDGATEVMRTPSLGLSLFRLRDPRPGRCP